MLAAKISDTNFDGAFKCIKKLIEHNVNVNIPGIDGETPIMKILKNEQLNYENKKSIVEYLIQNADGIDIDSANDGEARALIEDLLPDLELPGKVKNYDFYRLANCLESKHEDEFITAITEKGDDLEKLFAQNGYGGKTLLILAVEKGLANAVEKMLDLGADVNASNNSGKDPLTPVKCACIYGFFNILEVLLRSPKLDLHNIGSLLSITVKNIGKEATDKINYEKCFKMLLDRNIDVNGHDSEGCSPLHYAIYSKNETATLDLLTHDAYIEVNDRIHKNVISANPQVIEKHLDNCITADGPCTAVDDFEIHFNYRNFVLTESNERNSLRNNFNEMASIEYMAESIDLRPLIRHPLIASFLFLKWNRLAFIFYLNFCLCLLFAVSTVYYILACYINTPESVKLENFVWSITLVLTIYIGLRELGQFIFSPWAYLKSLENYMECGLVVLVTLILFNSCSESWRRTIASTSILLVCVEIFLLAGSLPFLSFSTHYFMLRTVTQSFLKSFLLYAIIFFAFSLSFFTLLHEKPESKDNRPNEGGEEEEEEGELNKFSNLGLSVIKTLVMSTGEFDAGSIKFQLDPSSYFVFTAFLFIISTVLLNLLNGLAVSDTQAIKSEAELLNNIRRCQVLARYERAFLVNGKWNR